MLLKRYIGIVVLMLVLVGAIHQQNVDVPNQEILLQFHEQELTTDTSKATIAIVEKELNNVGVQNFHVKEVNIGVFKITYYSDTDVEAVKRLLTHRIRAELGSDSDDIPLDYPIDQDVISYNLDVYEIKNGTDSDSGLNGITVAEFNHKADRFSKPKHTYSALNISHKADILATTRNVKGCSCIVLALQNTLQQIPDVRAGPLS
ncbi:MAG: hypothetical protein ACON5F_09650 [Jejuia sp.]